MTRLMKIMNIALFDLHCGQSFILEEHDAQTLWPFGQITKGFLRFNQLISHISIIVIKITYTLPKTSEDHHSLVIHSHCKILLFIFVSDPERSPQCLVQPSLTSHHTHLYISCNDGPRTILVTNVSRYKVSLKLEYTTAIWILEEPVSDFTLSCL